MKGIFQGMYIFFLFISLQTLAQPHYHYITYLPQKYDNKRHHLWPLIIYLHGSSACGEDLNKLRRYGLPFFTDHGMQIDAVAISPQCPTGKSWTSENWLDPFLREVIKKYRIDTCRIYLTGMSLGGFGTWELAIRYPQRFAAIAPMCGGGKPQLVCAIKNGAGSALKGSWARERSGTFCRNQCRTHDFYRGADQRRDRWIGRSRGSGRDSIPFDRNIIQ